MPSPQISARDPVGAHYRSLGIQDRALVPVDAGTTIAALKEGAQARIATTAARRTAAAATAKAAGKANAFLMVPQMGAEIYSNTRGGWVNAYDQQNKRIMDAANGDEGAEVPLGVIEGIANPLTTIGNAGREAARALAANRDAEIARIMGERRQAEMIQNKLQNQPTVITNGAPRISAR